MSYLVRRRIMELTGCSGEEAVSIELAARLINKQESLITIECLSAPEFANLIVRADRLRREVRSAIRDVLDPDEEQRP